MKLEKVLFFYGSGANGKSVLLNIIRALIGEQQCCEFSLESITKEQFTRAQLGNYIFNLCTEISGRLKTDIFKTLASREPLSARHPYGRPFQVKDYATSIFAMNELPKDVEQTNAFYRRFLIIPFDVRIPDEEQDHNLASKIINNEMSGVLNYVIKGAKSLLKKWQFDIPLAIQNVVEKFRQESDSVLMFIEENRLRPSSTPWKSLPKAHTSYRKQCCVENSHPIAKRTFAKRLRALGFTVKAHGKAKVTTIFAEQMNDAE